jgi:hypothetical protein
MSATRRALLAGAGAAAVLPGAVVPAEAATGPDAALVALCRDFVEIDRRWCDLTAQGDRLLEGPEHDAVWAQARALAYNFDRRKTIAEMPAATLAGLRAEAEAIAQDWSDATPRDDGAVMALSLARDVLKMVGA